MELSNKNLESSDTIIYDVTVKNVKGDGTYFDFTFGIENPDSQSTDTLTYRLYPLQEPRYPQKELVYTNFNSKKGLLGDCTEVVKFTAPMPDGYIAAYQIARNQEWAGLKGKLSISRRFTEIS